MKNTQFVSVLPVTYAVTAAWKKRFIAYLAIIWILWLSTNDENLADMLKDLYMLDFIRFWMYTDILQPKIWHCCELHVKFRHFKLYFGPYSWHFGYSSYIYRFLVFTLIIDNRQSWLYVRIVKLFITCF